MVRSTCPRELVRHSPADVDIYPVWTVKTESLSQYSMVANSATEESPATDGLDCAAWSPIEWSTGLCARFEVTWLFGMAALSICKAPLGPSGLKFCCVHRLRGQFRGARGWKASGLGGYARGSV